MSKQSTGKAADYWEKVQINTVSFIEQASGFQKPSYDPAGPIYWCYTMDGKVKVEVVDSVSNISTETEIHIRGFPTIDARSRVTVLTTDWVYDLKGIKMNYDAGETVLVGRRIPSLEAE